MQQGTKKLFIIGSILGFMAVALGAFGAHGLKAFILEQGLPIERLDIYKTGISYQFYHTFALFVALLIPSAKLGWQRIAAWFFILGILLFSGSLYLLAVREFIPIPTAILGPITPIGGLCFLIGWLFLCFSILKGELLTTKETSHE